MHALFALHRQKNQISPTTRLPSLPLTQPPATTLQTAGQPHRTASQNVHSPVDLHRRQTSNPCLLNPTGSLVSNPQFTLILNYHPTNHLQAIANSPPSPPPASTPPTNTPTSTPLAPPPKPAPPHPRTPPTSRTNSPSTSSSKPSSPSPSSLSASSSPDGNSVRSNGGNGRVSLSGRKARGHMSS